MSSLVPRIRVQSLFPPITEPLHTNAFNLSIGDIHDSDDRAWLTVDQLIRLSFPPDERTSVDSIRYRLQEQERSILPTILRCRVARIDQQVVGFTFFDYVPATGFTYLDLLSVHPAHRQHGIGRRLFRDLTRLTPSLAAQRNSTPRGIIFEVDHPDFDVPELRERNLRRIRFYEGLGAHTLPLEFRVPSFDNEDELETERVYLLMTRVLDTTSYLDEDYVQAALATILSESTIGYHQVPNTPLLAETLKTWQP